MHINGNKHPILWWFCYGIPFMIYSFLPRAIKRNLFYKYSNYAKILNKKKNKFYVKWKRKCF